MVPSNNGSDGFSRGELRTLRSLNEPIKIQRFLDKLDYHVGKTAWSPRRVLEARTAHCLEGATFAAAALRVNGWPPLLWDLEAVRDDDHVLAVYRVRGHWGSIAISNYSGLRFREPVYRSLRELALSMFDDYFNYGGDRTLRAYATRPVDLGLFDDRGWMTSSEDLWYVPEYLCDVAHTKLLSRWMEARLHRVSSLSLRAGLLGSKMPAGRKSRRGSSAGSRRLSAEPGSQDRRVQADSSPRNSAAQNDTKDISTRSRN